MRFRPNLSRRSKLTLPALAIAATLALSGCSDKSTGGTADTRGPKGTAEGASDLKLVKDGQLTVCSDMPYEPFEFEENGETQGFDYQIVSAMAENMGLKTAEFVTTPFDSIIPALAAGNCDMIASAMTITDERAEKVTFTDPYFDADQSLLVLKENEDKYKTLDDLEGQTIGVQNGTTGESYAEENEPDGATIKKFGTGDEIFPALVSGDVSAALQDLPVNAYRANTAPDQFTVTETFKTDEQYGFAVQKDAKDLAESLNDALEKVRSDGVYDEVYKKWFGDKN